MARIQMRGFHCNDESGARAIGSDEVVFCVGMFGVNTSQRYDEWRRFEYRLNTGVDSGEDHWFSEPIDIRVEEDDGAGPLRYIEFHVAAFELEGSGSSETLARRLYERWRTAIDEELHPQRFSGLPDSDRFGTARDGAGTASDSADGHELLVVDAWRLNVLEPMEPTTSAPGVGQSNGLYVGWPIDQVHRSPSGVQRFVHPDRVIDRRSFGSVPARSGYRFDTIYMPS